MTIRNWQHDVNGLFSDASKWSPSHAPVTGDDVSLGSNDDLASNQWGTYTVTCDLSITLYRLVLPNPNATLVVAQGSALAAGGNVIEQNNGTIVISGRLGYGGKELDNFGTVKVADGGTFSIYSGGLQNLGLIELDSVGTNNDFFYFPDIDLTLAGGGTVKLAGSGRGIIESNGTSHTLTNQDNVIIGGGYLGNAAMTLNNKASVLSAIDATPGALVVNTGSATIQNSGNFIALNTDLLLESKVSNASTGFLDSYGNGTLYIDKDVDNFGHINAYKGEVALRGVIINNFSTGSLTSQSQAQGNTVTSAITLQGGTIIKGGVLYANGGLIQVLAGSSAVLDGSTLPVYVIGNTTQMSVQDGASLKLIGTISNYHQILVQKVKAEATNLVVQGNVALNGSGAVNLDRGQIVSNGEAATLTSTNALIGTGIIGDTNLKIVNKNIIYAYDLSRQYALAISTGAGVDNSAGILMGFGDGVGGGDLKVVSTSVQNGKGGMVLGYGAGGHVDLIGAVVQDGTLTSAQGGDVRVMQITGNENTVLQGTVSNAGKLLVSEVASAAHVPLSITGTLNSSGTIAGQGTVSILGTVNSGGNITADQNGKELTFSNRGSGVVSSGLINAINGAKLTFATDLGSNPMLTNSSNAYALGFDVGGNAVDNTILKFENGTVLNRGVILSYGGGKTANGEAQVFISNATINNQGQGSVVAAGGGQVSLFAGTISGGSTFIGAGSQLTSVINNSFITSNVTNDGTLKVNAPLLLTGTYTGSGSTWVNGSRLEVNGDFTGGGSIDGTTGAATLQLDGKAFVMGSQAIHFKGSGDSLILEQAKTSAVILDGLNASGRVVDLVDIPFANTPTFNLSVVGGFGVLRVATTKPGVAHDAATLYLTNGSAYQQSSFHASNDGTGGTTVSYSPPSGSASSSGAGIDRLVQAMASFGADSAIIGTSSATGATSTTTSDFLAVPAAHA